MTTIKELQMEWGRKRDAKGTGRLQKHSALTAFPPPGCLRVLGEAMLTNRASGRLRVSVGRETKTTTPVGVGQERGCQGIDCLQKQVPCESLLILATTGKAGTKVSQGQQFGLMCGLGFVLGEVQSLSLFLSGAGNKLQNRCLSC